MNMNPWGPPLAFLTMNNNTVHWMIFKLFSSLLLFWYLTDGLEKMCVYVHTESSPVFNESSLLSWYKLIVNTYLFHLTVTCTLLNIWVIYSSFIKFLCLGFVVHTQVQKICLGTAPYSSAHVSYVFLLSKCKTFSLFCFHGSESLENSVLPWNTSTLMLHSSAAQ